MKTCPDHPKHREEFLAAYHQALTLRAARNMIERRPIPAEECQQVFILTRRAWIDGHFCTCAIAEVKTP